MGTNALIIFKEINGNCNCINVNWDGYITGGVGELLYRHWNNTDDIKNLCKIDKCIRSFADNINNIEFYEDRNSNKFAKSLKNLSYDEAMNKVGNYDFSYVWSENDVMWTVVKDRNEVPLKVYFNN